MLYGVTSTTNRTTKKPTTPKDGRLHTTRKGFFLERTDALRHRQRANLPVTFLNGNTLTARTCETAKLYAPNSAEDVLVSSGGIKNIDLSIITLEIEIVHHG